MLAQPMRLNPPILGLTTDIHSCVGVTVQVGTSVLRVHAAQAPGCQHLTDEHWSWGGAGRGIGMGHPSILQAVLQCRLSRGRQSQPAIDKAPFSSCLTITEVLNTPQSCKENLARAPR